MITQQTLLNVDGYEKLRIELLNEKMIINMLHLGSNAIDGGLGTVSFVLKPKNNNEKFLTVKLSQYDTSDEKEKNINNKENYYWQNFDDMKLMAKNIIAYDVKEKILKLFNEKKIIKDVSDVKSGLITSDNNRFLRFWFEINNYKMCYGFTNKKNKKWFKHAKGGGYRKWYGNYEYVLNWENDGKEMIDFAKELYTSYSRTIKNVQFYFKEGLSWSMTTFSSDFSLRSLPEDFIFNVEAPALFNCKDKRYIMGLLNSVVGKAFLLLIKDDVHYKTKDIEKVPFIYCIKKTSEIGMMVDNCIHASKEDWDSFETSWDFKKHPLV